MTTSVESRHSTSPDANVYASSDSIGTDSPDLNSEENGNSYFTTKNHNHNHPSSTPIIQDMNLNHISNMKIQYNDVEITEDQINSGILIPLQVRRGSEPVLNHLSPDHEHSCNELDATKRWSTAVAVDSNNRNHNRNASNNSLVKSIYLSN
jgi:hypothetical protein